MHADDDASEVNLAATVVGEGVPIVFTHGWADDRTAWTDVVAGLDGNRCISWDLRGHGESDVAPPGHYTRDHALADLESIVDQAGRPCVLVGHSLGGYLSLAYALRHPADVRGLVLVAAGPGFRKDDSRKQWNESVAKMAAKLGVPPGSEELSKHVDSWVIDSLGDITAPALVLVGEHDKRFAASAAVFEKTLNVQSSLVIADAGHNVHKSQGAAVADEIKAFVGELA